MIWVEVDGDNNPKGSSSRAPKDKAIVIVDMTWQGLNDLIRYEVIVDLNETT